MEKLPEDVLMEIMLWVRPQCLIRCKLVKGAGLSRDCRSDDYKFVVFGYDSKSYDSKAEIYSLHNDCWREISFHWGGTIDYEIRSFWLVNSQIFSGGVLCWTVDHFRYSIIAFVVTDEEVHSLQFAKNSSHPYQSGERALEKVDKTAAERTEQ
ncbi:hypothetical protein L484_005796 [Morus notabilis]|uniref:F-box domain-containing protein n=1 Tax=Morus notabilis TaxID=981085 RepID=W9RJU3_9ROSA|nr:hypothetical protein L484_005796 [Morus notabilis]